MCEMCVGVWMCLVCGIRVSVRACILCVRRVCMCVFCERNICECVRVCVECVECGCSHV